MAEAGSINVKLTADSTELEKALGNAKRSVESFSRSAANIAKTAGIAFAGMAGAIGIVTRAASRQIAAEQQLANAFKATGQAIDVQRVKDLASALQQVTTFGDEASLEAAGLLARFGATEDSVVALLPRVQDLAAGLGIDLRTAALLAGKAMSGQASTLSRYGIILSEAEQNALKFGNQQQRVATLTAVLDSRMKGAAQTAASTAAAAFTQVTNSFGDLLEEIGKIIDSPLQQFFTALRVILDRIVAVVSALPPEFKKWAARIALGATAVTGLVAGLAGLLAVLSKLGLVMAAFAAKALLGLLALIPPIAAIAAGIAGIILIVGAVKKAWDANLLGMQKSTSDFGKGMIHGFRIIIMDIQEAFDKFSRWFSEKFITIFAFVTGKSADWAAEMIRQSEAAGGLFNVDDTIDNFEKGFEALKGAVGTGLSDVVDTFKVGLDVIGGQFRSIMESMGIDVDGLLEKLKGLNDVTLPTAGPGPTIPGAGAGAGAGPGPAADKALADGVQTAQTLNQHAGQIASALGPVGNVLGALAKGGAVAAIIAVIVEAIKGLASFQRIFATFSGIMLSVGRGFSPVLSAIAPLVEVLGKLFGAYVELFVKFNPIFILLVLLAPLIEKLAMGLNWVVTAIIFAINSVISGIASALGKIPGIGKSIKKAINSLQIGVSSEMDTAIQSFELPKDEIAEAGENMAGAISDGAKTATNSIAEANEALANVPQGLKLAALRFDAIQGAAGLGAEDFAAPGGAGGTNIGSVTVIADDPEEFLRKLQEQAAWQNVANNGTSLQTSPRFIGGESGE